jgi:DNA processing protein
MDDALLGLAYISDMSARSTKLGSIIHDAPGDGDLDIAVAWLLSRIDATGRPDLSRYHDTIQRLLRMNVSMIHFFSPSYPERLRELREPPVVLYIKGSLDGMDDAIAVSGSRNASNRGREAARRLATDLARMGFPIVAGLARGIDTEAHLGALEGGGRTVAVLPGPITKVYPRENEGLADDIALSGAVVSELSPLEGIDRLSFIRRNRITTGLSRCLVLGESDGTGGTFQQFKVAKMQGRPVFALRPDESEGLATEGFVKFTREGAVPVEGANDVVEQLKRGPLNQSNLSDFP